jgi:hypothetical protein
MESAATRDSLQVGASYDFRVDNISGKHQPTSYGAIAAAKTYKLDWCPEVSAIETRSFTRTAKVPSLHTACALPNYQVPATIQSQMEGERGPSHFIIQPCLPFQNGA